MQTLVANFTILMVIGLALTIGVSRMHRGIGGVIGILVWSFAGVVGNTGYDMGGGIALLGMKLPREAFLGLVGVLIVINVMAVIQWVRRRGR
ncbi:MAG: hypothetical protein U1E65_05085 [Myxococcota bacterium]